MRRVIMHHEFEKTYLVPFADQRSAVECLNDLMKEYNHPPYTINVRPTGYSVEYVVIFPEGAMPYLSEDLQKKAEMCVFPFQCGYFVPTVYRFMEECYIDEFLTNGELQISTFAHCKRLEDATRRDGKEGQSVIVGEYGEKRMEAHIGTGDNAFLLCTSLKSEYTNELGITSSTALEIFNVSGFVDACTKSILEMGYHVLNVQIGPCYYSEKKIFGLTHDGEIEKIINEENHTFDFEQLIKVQNQIAGPKMYFQKPLEKACELEYRVVWTVFPTPKERTLLIHIDNPLRYARKINHV